MPITNLDTAELKQDQHRSVAQCIEASSGDLVKIVDDEVLRKDRP